MSREPPMFPGIKALRKEYPTGYLLRIQVSSPTGGLVVSTGPANEAQVKAIFAALHEHEDPKP